MARKKKSSKSQPSTSTGAGVDEDVVTGPKTYTETAPIGAAFLKGWTAHEFTDAKVIAGEGDDMKTFNVNSALLSWRSEYFRNCFYGGYAETSDKSLRKPNVSPKVMEHLLKFLYSGQLTLDDDADLSVDLIVAADELSLADAAKIVSDDLVSRMAADTSAVYLRNAYQRGLRALAESCMGKVLANAENVLEDEEFMTLPDEALTDMIANDKLSLAEDDVWKFMVKLATNKCGVKEQDSKKWTKEENAKVKEAISPMLPYLRIYLLDAEFVSETLEPTGSFKPEEFNLIYKRLVVPSCVPADHPLAKPREVVGVNYFCNAKDLKQIFTCLGKRYKLKLLMRASVDGFQASAFHKLCDNQGPTLTFVSVLSSNKKVKHVAVGFAPVSWTSCGNYVNNASGQLFAINPPNGQGFTQFKLDPSLSTYCMNDSSTYGPTFGGGHDLHLENNCNTSSANYTNLNHTYKGTGAGQTLFFGTYNFQVDDFAVYQLL